jgi:hypothetical protein
LFRFSAVYLFLFIFPSFPLLNWTAGPPHGFTALWNMVVPWFASHVLHRRVTGLVFGDNTYGYARTLLFILVSAAATLIWSIADRRRPNYAKLQGWITLYVRLALGTSMLFYGIIKFFPHGQFQEPGLARMLQPLGELNPQSLLWTFMGYSRPYTTFTGIVEVSGGILLFVPWLSTLGAIISFAALTHVFLLNMCYGVNLKLYSFHLLLMALFLLAPELRWLGQAIVMRQAARPRASFAPFRDERLTKAATALQIALGIAVLVFIGIAEWQRNHRWDLPRSPLYGIWKVEDYVVDGPGDAAKSAGVAHWTRVVFDDPLYGMRMDFAIQAADGSSQFFLLHYDGSRKTLGLSKLATLLKCYDDTDGDHWDNFRQKELQCPVDAQFSFEQRGFGELTLDGVLDHQQIRARLRRVEREF